MRGMVTGGLVLLILTSIGGFWWPATAQAATCAVTNLNDSGGGSLRDRLADANCSTITFDVTGTILLAENFSTLAIRRPVVISGPGADTLTISGNKRAGVFRLTNAGNVTLSGLTIADTTGGAAISSADTALTIQNSTIRNSDRTGVANNGGSLKISNSTIRDHTNTSTTTSSGGGIYSGGADVTLDGVTLSGNTAQGGGGINFFGGQEGRSLAITNSTIVGNTSRGGSVNSAVGGGIYASGGALRIANSTIEGNKSEGAGSGLYYTTTGTQEITITNSTFSGNTSGVRGGALTWNGNGVPQLSFVTVTGNTVGDRSGAGITPSSTGTVTLRNSVVVGNRNADGSSDCSVPLRSAGANVGGDGCLSGGGGDLTVTDAATVLSPTLADNGGPTRTHALAVGSPAIDRVPLVDCAPANGVDQRGTPRPSGAACDSGAFEVVAVAPSPTPTPTPEPSPTPTPAPSVAPSPPPSPSPAPSATPPPSVAPSPSASPVPSATPKPSASPVPPPSAPPTPPATGSGGNLPGLPNTGAGGNEAGAMAMLPGYLLIGGLAVGLLVGGLVARRRT